MNNLFKKKSKAEFNDIIHQDHSLYMDGNYVQYTPHNITNSSQTSSFILAKAFENLPLHRDLIIQIKFIQNRLGYGNTVWAVRFEEDEFTMEIYFYYPDLINENSFDNIKEILNLNLKNPIDKELPKDYRFGCISYNLDGKKSIGINLLGIKKDYEWKRDNCINTFSFFWEPITDKLSQVNQYFSYRNPNNFGQISMQLKHSCTKIFPNARESLFDFYLYYPFLHEGDKFIYPMGIGEKNGAIGLYFYDLSINQFIQFLEYFNYPSTFIETMKREKNNIEHIKYDIGVDFYVADNKICIKKTTFAGTF